jgi:hypothetical protein
VGNWHARGNGIGDYFRSVKRTHLVQHAASSFGIQERCRFHLLMQRPGLLPEKDENANAEQHQKRNNGSIAQQTQIRQKV